MYLLVVGEQFMHEQTWKRWQPENAKVKTQNPFSVESIINRFEHLKLYLAELEAKAQAKASVEKSPIRKLKNTLENYKCEVEINGTPMVFKAPMKMKNKAQALEKLSVATASKKKEIGITQLEYEIKY